MSETDKARVAARRALVAGAAAAMAGVLLAPGIRLVEVARAAPRPDKPGEPVSSKVRWGLLIDANLCTEGCRECVLACNRENGLEGETRPTDSQWIRKVELLLCQCMLSGSMILVEATLLAVKGRRTGRAQNHAVAGLSRHRTRNWSC